MGDGEMVTISMTLHYVYTPTNGNPPRSASEHRLVQASCEEDVAKAAAEMLEGCPDDRAFVSHSLDEGKAFSGYRKMPDMYYGVGLQG